MKVLTPDCLSPEESVDEHGDFQQFIVRRQPWQNERFKALKDKLEEMEQDHAQPTTSEAVEGRHVSIVPSKKQAPKDCPKLVRREDDKI